MHHNEHHKEDPSNSDHLKSSTTLSLEDKLGKLLSHWVSHNDDHARNYRNWGAQAKAKDLNEVARLLEEAAQMTEKVSEKFTAAAFALKPDNR